jgi:2-octaprenylphenol hydroxylase
VSAAEGLAAKAPGAGRPTRFDVAVVGAGMVGGSLACAFAAAGLSTVVVEASPGGMPRERGPDAPFDLRVSALTRASEALLRRLEVWGGVERRRLAPFREMVVWDAGSAGSLRFDCAELAEPALGYIVENAVVVEAIEERLATLAGLHWLRPAEPVALEVDATEARLRLADRTVRAALVVGADGARSRLRELAGIGLQRSGYGQSALVATVRPELPHRDTAWQRFLPGGPLAFLPLAGGMCSIVWSAPPAMVEELLDLPESVFAVRLEEAFEWRLGRVTWVGERAAYPLYRQHAERYVRARVALVGDAAHTIHPLAGQGVNLGFLDAAALAEVVVGAHQRGLDPGALAVLRRYERWRTGHNHAVQAAMDGFRLLFGSDLGALRALRGLGLQLTDAAPAVKALIMRHAMGLAGDLPALARSAGVTPA